MFITFYTFFQICTQDSVQNAPQKSMMGSPIVKFLSTVHGKLKSLAMMNLKILFTLMLCVALEKKRVAFIALAYALAYMKVVQRKLNLLKRVMHMNFII